MEEEFKEEVSTEKKKKVMWRGKGFTIIVLRDPKVHVLV
jgi:hypothetical protein